MDNPLEYLAINTPCTVDWNGMSGDERVRFCNLCQLHVYNISALTHFEAEALLNTGEDKICVRYYRREDGTVLTRDCQARIIHQRKLSRRIKAGIAAIGTVITLAGPLSVVAKTTDAEPVFGQKQQCVASPADTKNAVMGDMAVPAKNAKEPKDNPPPVHLMGKPMSKESWDALHMKGH